jgi:exopolysaccharide production protein ExoZ
VKLRMPSTPAPKFLGIQALRIVAACLVVVTHSTFYAAERLDRNISVWHRGTRGVDIFFVISGFVMIYSSQKLFGLSEGWKTFAKHRIVRIVPLYWLVTTLKVLIVLFTAGFALHTVLNLTTATCSYLFLPARNLDGKLEPLVGVGWTLNLEMLFYFLFTLALFFRVSVFRYLGVILALLAIGSYFRNPSWPPVGFYFQSIVLEFYFGMLIAKAHIKGSHVPRRLAYFLAAVGFGVLLLPPMDGWGLPKALISGVPAALIVCSAVSVERLETWIPRFLLYLGDASYAVYLIHPFVCPIAPTVLRRLHFDSPWLSVVLSVALGLGAGCILHRCVELPMTNWLKTHIKARGRSLSVAA